MSRTPFFGVWAHSWAQNGPGRENPIWTCFVTATWPFWTKNGVKSAFLVGLRQNKAQKWWKRVKRCLKRSFSVVLTYFLALTTAPRLLPEVLGLGCTRDSISSFWPLSSSRIDPDPHERPLHSFSCVFFIISGLYLAQNRPELHFLCKFSANNDHFWGIRKILTQKWRRKCISGRFQAK